MKRLLPVTVVLAVALSACAARGVRIAELQDNPDKYDDDTVSVTGTVVRSWGFTPLPFQLYSIDDGSGELTVVSNSNRAPRSGARVKVKGKISEVAVFGGRSIGLHLQEEDRDIR